MTTKNYSLVVESKCCEGQRQDDAEGGETERKYGERDGRVQLPDLESEAFGQVDVRVWPTPVTAVFLATRGEFPMTHGEILAFVAAVLK